MAEEGEEMRILIAFLLVGCRPHPHGPSDVDAGVANGLPIQHVVVLVKENHTFDNYFGSFSGAEGTSTYQTKDGATHDCPRALSRTARDIGHQRSDALASWNNGAMNGWEDAEGGTLDDLAWSQYQEADIPRYWALARNYGLADHFFAGVMGPSFPGHMFLLAAQAAWSIAASPTNVSWPYWGCDQTPENMATVIDDCTPRQAFPCFDIPSVPDVLPAGVSWKFYGTDFYGAFPYAWSMFDAIKPIRQGPGWANVVTVDQFTYDLEHHALPNVVWIVNQDLSSEHPKVSDVCEGENWTMRYVDALMQSDYWASTALFITWDDYGGFYDHVPPPRQYGCSSAPYGLGFRLPLIIVSPYAKRGVFKEVSEQASIPRFIERVFGAGLLSDLDPAAQDGMANDLFGAFDFTRPPLVPMVQGQRSCGL